MIMITLPISVNVPYAHVGWIHKAQMCAFLLQYTWHEL